MTAARETSILLNGAPADFRQKIVKLATKLLSDYERVVVRESLGEIIEAGVDGLNAILEHRHDGSRWRG